MQLGCRIFVFLVIGLITATSYGLQLTCGMDEVKKDSRNCTRGFIGSMTSEDQLSNCSDAFKTMHSCVHNIVFTKCFTSIVSRIPGTKVELENVLELYLRPLTNLDVMFCGKTVGKRVNVSTVPSFFKSLVPCEQEAYTKGPACALDFFNAFQANKTDPTLCRKYIKVKECEQNVRKTYCKKEMAPEVDPYDPFCTAAPNVRGPARQHGPMDALVIFSVMVLMLLIK